jgi:hypothetical protein
LDFVSDSKTAIEFFKTAAFNLPESSGMSKVKISWVQDWVQLKKEKRLAVSYKRHQIGHLDF